MTPAQLRTLDSVIRDGRGLSWRDCEFIETIDHRHRGHELSPWGAWRLGEIAKRMFGGATAVEATEDVAA